MNKSFSYFAPVSGLVSWHIGKLKLSLDAKKGLYENGPHISFISVNTTECKYHSVKLLNCLDSLSTSNPHWLNLVCGNHWAKCLSAYTTAIMCCAMSLQSADLIPMVSIYCCFIRVFLVLLLYYKTESLCSLCKMLDKDVKPSKNCFHFKEWYEYPVLLNSKGHQFSVPPKLCPNL